MRHQPTGYTVADGKLTLPAAHGDFFANAPNNNPNIILQPAPSGSWTAETRMTFLPNENYEQAGLLVYGDDANYVKADLVHANGRGVEFLREVNNVASGFGGFVGLPGSAPATVDLRITSDGTTLRAFWRHPGEAWKPYGEPAALSAVPNPKIGIYANDSNATVTTRDDAVFDYFRLTAGLPDTTAPTTTHTLAPAAPDGQNGWYRTDVTLTLATESGATTQYKIGDGAFGAYSGPVTLSGPGTTTVTYRSTDAEGNVEADKTVTVKIDKVAPTSTATLDPAQPGAGGTYSGPVNVTLAGEDAAGGAGLEKLEYRLDGGEWTLYSAPVTVSQTGQHTLEHRATDLAGNQGQPGTVTFAIAQAGQSVSTPGDVTGSVPGTMSLTLGGTATFSPFIPGATQDYVASTTATVTSTAENTTLSVTDPSETHTGRMVNGAHALAQPLHARATSPRGTGGAFAPIGGTSSPITLLTYGQPVSKDVATVEFRQSIAETDGLRRGTYGKTLTFTLSTTTP